jgi:hypothetical protein
MNAIRTFGLGVALAASAACSHGNQTAQSDSALSRDLTTAGTPAPTTDTVSAVERTGAAPAAGPQRSAASTNQSATARTHHASSAGEVSRGSAGSASGTASSGTASSGTSSSQSTTHTVTVKHPQRDAAIGAAAGAIIGAATSHDKVKGGVVGGAAGAILGGVIGNNVDKKKKPVP